MGEMAAAGIAEQRETIEGEAIALGNLLDHVDEGKIVADVGFENVFEAVAVAVAANAGGKQRAQDDAVVPAAEFREGVAIRDETAAGAMHGNDEFGRMRGLHRKRAGHKGRS